MTECFTAIRAEVIHTTPQFGATSGSRP